jgi:carbon-monoxide dehydrogenase medium subunit
MLLGLPEFDVLEASTIAEACSLLSQHAGEARVLAGGTDLLVRMKNRGILPRYLINIKQIPDLDQIRYDQQSGLRIGALTTIEAIKDSALMAQKCPLLSQTAAKVGTLAIRNLGTLGGNLANASPAAEFAPSLLTLNASVKCIGTAGERIIALDDLFVGPGKTVLRDEEVITEVLVPNPASHTGGIYIKHSLREMDVAVASAAVVVHLEGEVCRDAKIALGAVAPTPFRAKKAEGALKNRKLGENGFNHELLEEIAQIATGEALPIDDLRAYISYRRTIVGMMVRQGLEEAITQAKK